MPASPHRLRSLAWGSSQASAALAISATAWMLSWLTPSPLLNGLLPATAAVAALLPLRPRTGLGVALQVLALLALAVVAIRLEPTPGTLPALITLGAMLLWAIGNQLSLVGLHHYLLTLAAVPLAALRISSETGHLLGHLLMGLLFPLGKSLSQFSAALLLLLPLMPTVLQARQPWRVAPDPGGAAPAASASHLNRRALLQGLLFGGLFALLPLWVRLNAQGTCLDFGVLLTAYALGKTAATAVGESSWLGSSRSPATAGAHYGAMGLLLIASQLLPGWAAVGLFLPFGLLAGLRDRGLLLACRTADGLPDLAGFERSGAIGGLVGAVAMGLLSQVLGLTWALPLQVGGFLLAALLAAGGLGGHRRGIPAP